MVSNGHKNSDMEHLSNSATAVFPSFAHYCDLLTSKCTISGGNHSQYLRQVQFRNDSLKSQYFSSLLGCDQKQR